jgi:hypothetical protein
MVRTAKNITVSNPNNASLFGEAQGNLALADLRKQVYQWKITKGHGKEEQG